MCWKSEKATKQIADKDIFVFKVVVYDGNTIISSYYKFKYKKGIVYSTEIGKPISYDITHVAIHKGFHSYSNSVETAIDDNFYVVNPNKKYRAVFYNREIPYAYNNMELGPNAKYVKIKCIIPKGSEYYVNERGEYVSNQIKIINECVGRLRKYQ